MVATTKKKVVLGIDWGKKRIGLAIGREGLAEPLTIIKVSDQTTALGEIAKICRREGIGRIILGLPLKTTDHPIPQAREVKEFAQKLSRLTGLKIIFWNEVLTSEEALSKMIKAGKRVKKRRFVDDVAAALILQEYLDSQDA